VSILEKLERLKDVKNDDLLDVLCCRMTFADGPDASAFVRECVTRLEEIRALLGATDVEWSVDALRRALDGTRGQRKDPLRHFDGCPNWGPSIVVFFGRAFTMAANIEADAAVHKRAISHLEALRNAEVCARAGTPQGDLRAAAWHIVAIRLLSPRT